MTGYVAGRVIVPVVPDLRGFQKTVGKGAAGAGTQLSQNLAKSSESSFSKLGGTATKSLKRGLKFGAIGATITAGLAIKGGLTRLMGIEDARASLDGLGHDAKSIDKIMKNALNSVKGTAFGMADAGKVAASAVAAGVKPGKDLERTLKLVGDGATIAKTSFGEMGSIFGKVAASNKIQGDVIAQLNDQGIPIVKLLSKELGKSSEETIKLASQGKVDFKTFQNAMESGLGGAAKKSGNTMRGSFANMQAALGRIGANLLSGFFPKIRGGIQGITKWLDPMEDKAAVAGKALGDFATKYGPKFRSILSRIGGVLQTAVEGIKDMAKFVKDTVTVLWDYKEVIGVVVAGLVAYKAIQLAVNAAGWASYLWQSREVIIGAARIAITNAMTASQIALNAAMKANVLGIIITGLTLLVAGLVIAYKKSDTFRNIVNKVWASIKSGLASAWSYIKPVLSNLADFFGKVIPPTLKVLQGVFKVVFAAIKATLNVAWWAIQSTFGMLKELLTRVIFPVLRFLYEKVFKPVFTKIGEIISGAWTNIIKPTFSKIGEAAGGVKKAFSKVVDGIKSAWDKIKSIMAAPVNWVITNVINKLIAAINKIPGVKDIKPLGTIGSGEDGIATTRQRGGGLTAQGGKGARGGRRGWGGKADAGKSGKRVWPSSTRTLSNNYAGHSGIDIAAPAGSAIRAASAGTVEYAGWGRGYGQAIFVRGDDGLTQIYGHSSKVNVRSGQRVSPGDTLGLVGSTGNSTGPHIHFEIAKSAPGTTSNRAATLSWLGGAKMGSGPSELDQLNSRVNAVSSSGKPKNSWFNISALTGLLKDAAKSAGKSILGAPGKAAKKVWGAVTSIGGIGGMGNMRPRRPKRPSLKSRLSASRRAERKIEKKLAATKKKANKKALRKQLAKQKRTSKLLARRVKAQSALKAAKRLPTSLSAAARSNLLGQTSSLTIGNGARIDQNFLRSALGTPAASQEGLRQGYVSAQSELAAAGNARVAADRRVAIAKAGTQTQTARIGDIDKELKGKRSEASLKKSLTTANSRIAAAQKRLDGAKTASEKKSAKAALAAAKANRDNIKKELASVRKLQAERAKLVNSKEAKALAAAQKDQAKAVTAQAAAQAKATTAAEKYREAQDAAIDRATSIKSAGVGLGSIASAGFKTGGGIISNLRKAVAIVPAWSNIVKELIGAGLRGPILEEFINAGPSAEAVFTGKSLLKSGGIGTINDLQNQLNAASIEAGSLAGIDTSTPGATGGGIAGSWSSSSAPYMSAVPSVAAGGQSGPGVLIAYSGMPSDTVESIAIKTSERVARTMQRAGA